MNNDMEIQQRIREEDRKARPRRLAFVLIALLIGVTVGGLIVVGGDLGEFLLYEAAALFGIYAAPVLLAAAAVALVCVCRPRVKQAEQLASGWDGEDEAVYAEVCRRVSMVSMVTNYALILDFFLFTAYVAYCFYGDWSFDLFLIPLAAFLITGWLVAQYRRKTVELIRRVQPEKQVSVYDRNFGSKWMACYDEAELQMIGRCALNAYMTTNRVCLFMACVLGIMALAFDIGFLPSLAVCTVWAVNNTAYYSAAIRAGKERKKKAEQSVENP